MCDQRRDVAGLLLCIASALFYCTAQMTMPPRDGPPIVLAAR